MTGEEPQQPMAASSDFLSDPGQRVQQVVLRWRGTERGQSIADLHNECRARVGAGGQRLVPERLLFVRNLDAATLKRELASRRLLRSESDPRFRGRAAGRFDAALCRPGPLASPPTVGC